jgi:hypothetical protein
MILRTKPEIWSGPITLIGTLHDQLAAARKACLIAYGKDVKWVTVVDDCGAVVSGAPLNMIDALHPERWGVAQKWESTERPSM